MAKRTKVPEGMPAPQPQAPVVVAPVVVAPVAAPVAVAVAPQPQAQASNVQQFDWSKSESTGFEHVRPEDMGIPFLMILQAMSPEVNKADPEYQMFKIEGAAAGDIIVNTTKEIVYDDDGDSTMDFVPFSFIRKWVEWKADRGGFVKQHDDMSILAQTKKDEKGRDVLANGNTIVTTAYFGGYLLREGKEPLRCIISMTSTQLKKSRYWINMATSMKQNGRTLPLFSHIYSLSTTPESNEKGSWYGWKIESGSMMTDVVLIRDCQEQAKQTIGATVAQLAPPVTKNDDDIVM